MYKTYAILNTKSSYNQSKRINCSASNKYLKQDKIIDLKSSISRYLLLL